MSTRHTAIKALLLELKTHLKATNGDPRADAAAYLVPPVKATRAPVKQVTKKRTVRKKRG